VNLVNEYDIDGLRIDTIPEIHVDFWQALTDRLGDAYTIGECYNGEYDTFRLFHSV